MKQTMAGCLGLAALLAVGSNLSAQATDAQKRVTAAAFHMPVAFEPNQGQAPKEFDYTAHGFGYSLGINSTRANVAIGGARDERPAVVSLTFPGSRQGAKAEGVEKLQYTTSYFLGSRKFVGVPTYAKLRYNNVWTGIDVVYYGESNGGEARQSNQLEYDFIVAPGADPAAVRLRFEGVDSVKTGSKGELVLSAKAVELSQKKPVAYQVVKGVRTDVAAAYRIQENGEVAIELGAYDRTSELVIDPVFIYNRSFPTAGYQGQTAFSGRDALAIVSEAAGSFSYLTGSTVATTYQVNTTNGLQTVGPYNSVFVAKFDNVSSSAASAVIVSAGDGNMFSTGIALDLSNRVYITGYTDAPLSLLLNHAYQGANGGGAYDAYVIKLDNIFSSVFYGSYLGGNGDDRATGIAVNPNTGIAYISGTTTSTNWPQASNPGGQNGFVYAIDTTQSQNASKVYGITLGGSGTDAANSIAIDGNSNVLIGGATTSTDFTPTSSLGYLNTKNNSSNDGFVLKLNSSGSPTWFTYFPAGPVSGISQYVNTQGNPSVTYAYVTGETSGNIFVTSNAYQVSGGAGHAFMTRFDTTTSGNSAVYYSTYLGGSGEDAGKAIVVAPNGRGYITGFTTSPNFPVVGVPSLQTNFTAGRKNGFLASIDTTIAGANGLQYSTLLGAFNNGGTTYDQVGTGVSTNSFGEFIVSETLYTGSTPVLPVAVKVGNQYWDPTFFITQQYIDLLNRQPDSGGLSYWTGLLTNNVYTRWSVAAQYFVAPEFQTAGLPIIEYYIALLGQDADYNGWVSYWNSWFSTGTTNAQRSLTAIQQSFFSKPGYAAIYGNLSDSAFTAKVFTNLLGRSATGGDASLIVTNGTAAGQQQTILNVIQSSEYQAKVRSRAFADLLYMGFLRRTPDPSGLAYWIQQINTTALPDVIYNWVTSIEYFNRFQ